MSYIANGARSKGNRMMIVVHRQELVKQTSKALAQFRVEHGFITADRPQSDAPVVVSMVQTLVKRLDVMPPDLLMIDEFHHGLAESYRQIILRFPKAKILGLTATPQRLDGRGLGAICEELVLGPTVKELIARGFLCQPIYYAPPTALDMSGVVSRGGDFARGETERRVDRPVITGSAVEHYQKICPGFPAVAFCTTVAHAQHVRDQFIAAGIPSATIDGKLNDDDRADRVEALTTGRIKILTSVDVVSEGFDLPLCSAAILLRPTESLGLHMQQGGRILRPYPGKIAYVLDHVGNCMRHGLLEEDRVWSLDGKVGKKSTNKAQQSSLLTCGSCHAIQAPAACCANCGVVFPVVERQVAEVDGSLEQLSAEKVAEHRAKLAKRVEVGRAKSRDELEAIAKQRGYKASWVRMMMSLRMKQKFAAKTQDFIESTRQGQLL